MFLCTDLESQHCSFNDNFGNRTEILNVDLLQEKEQIVLLMAPKFQVVRKCVFLMRIYVRT